MHDGSFSHTRLEQTKDASGNQHTNYLISNRFLDLATTALLLAPPLTPPPPDHPFSLNPEATSTFSPSSYTPHMLRLCRVVTLALIPAKNVTRIHGGGRGGSAKYGENEYVQQVARKMILLCKFTWFYSACCSVLQRVAACCSVLQRVAVCAVCCSVLQCLYSAVAVCCSV